MLFLCRKLDLGTINDSNFYYRPKLYRQASKSHTSSCYSSVEATQLHIYQVRRLSLSVSHFWCQGVCSEGDDFGLKEIRIPRRHVCSEDGGPVFLDSVLEELIDFPYTIVDVILPIF